MDAKQEVIGKTATDLFPKPSFHSSSHLAGLTLSLFLLCPTHLGQTATFLSPSAENHCSSHKASGSPGTQDWERSQAAAGQQL